MSIEWRFDPHWSDYVVAVLFLLVMAQCGYGFLTGGP